MAIREDLQHVLDGYAAAYRRGDAEGCAGIFAEDAEVYSPYAPPARGRAAISALHAEWTAEGSPDKTLRVLEAGESDNLAWCLAEFSEGSDTGRGISLNVLQRAAGGSWKIRMCSLNETFAGDG